MKLIEMAIADVKLIEPTVFEDERGFFYESFNERDFAAALGEPVRFVQDNHSLSVFGTLRGLHYQQNRPQGKLVRVIRGEAFDVAVDLRAGSATYGQSFCVRLNAAEKRQLWIPPGFAHGFLAMSETVELLYKATEYWDASDERVIAWDDPALAIAWPVRIPLLSAKDGCAPAFAEARPVVLGGTSSR
ncbi:dTDP-4-dehydrorhamnose 3,5-epimerase [Jeongeupia sp. HS-3]|uniref:dTDP-4-dehydrorhamnose 3,5-epimerase n=1 Tax=Jeongeupia sp. HS-3 TaxID=1009682 RepID=UPI0018A524F0|nr:dTDP-4-dehydrorhamnose 3,5-epimerase [Jeongeupia sp. HS-3]BCL76533.1 dTDP-4-dehydrorhamnose 3,5-epimerase [Jeongeupia sp. HS-3]